MLFIFAVIAIIAVILTRGVPLKERISIFSRGAGNTNLLLMVWIFMFAGAFAASAKEMGAASAMVDLTLHFLPAKFALTGLFLAACVTSLCMGTSVGTIVALMPIAVGLADKTEMAIPMVAASVIGGAFFGDNLSFISDTTIVATQSQGCQLSDKFRVNAFIVVPAALLILVVYYVLGQNTSAPQHIAAVEWVKVIPYLSVLVTAVCGMNVMAVLTLGIVLCGVIGIFTDAFDIYGWFGAMGDGILSMGELIIVTMMAGGLLELIRQHGGIDFIINLLTRRVNSKRGAELSIATLVSLVDVCTANNTVAILTVGGIAKQIGDRYGVDNKKCASILDTFSCTIQGLIPYGAQLLIAAGLASLNPVAILPYLYYPFVLGVVALLSILLRYPKRYS